jgi:hypothetical protein
LRKLQLGYILGAFFTNLPGHPALSLKNALSFVCITEFSDELVDVVISIAILDLTFLYHFWRKNWRFYQKTML